MAMCSEPGSILSRSTTLGFSTSLPSATQSMDWPSSWSDTLVDTTSSSIASTVTVYAEGAKKDTTLTSVVVITTTAEPPPAPTNGVFITFISSKATSLVRVKKNPAWAMFEQKLADHYDDICAWPAAATVAAPEEIGSSDVPWPPDLEAGESKIWGHSGCKYYGVKDGAGSFSCDGVEKVQCAVDSNVLDPKATKVLRCVYPLIENVLVPKVRCFIR
ncbi:hypothetical protein PG999_004472 [Apiospora kogelbergensis]|uniref:Uncharacterized protein n=1 Tax=Apiospora kogelbergensis TaxID=1337665 RepID=A0AAW0QZE8_9PEZI